jgi:response regulator RpfG family c-di-GMP phosphodiesterase
VPRTRVLLVDDEPELLVTLTAALDSRAEVVSAGTVAEALDLVAKEKFDVVVADLRLPDRWGDELLAHVAARSPSTRRLLLTGDASPQRTVRELLEAGVIQAYFKKPRAEGLLDAICRQPEP